MAVEENKAVVHRFFDEVMNAHNAAAIDQILAPNFLNYFAGRPPSDRETVRRYLPLYPAAFPDVHTTVEDMVAENDQVSVRFTLRGTHQGEFMGLPPSGRAVTMGGMALFRLANGQIIEEYVNEDTASLIQQISPAPPRPAAP